MLTSVAHRSLRMMGIATLGSHPHHKMTVGAGLRCFSSNETTIDLTGAFEVSESDGIQWPSGLIESIGGLKS